jgi:hypothetical protein
VSAPQLSASIAHLLESRSPRHAWEASRQLNPDAEREDDGRFDIGNVVHELLLVGESRAVVGEWDEYRTNTAKAWRDGIRAQGLIPLRPKDSDRVFSMIARVREQLDAFELEIPLLEDGVAEIDLAWEENGVACKARVDWLRHDFRSIEDLKTTSRSASPEGFARRLYDIGADVQAAFYLRGVWTLSEGSLTRAPEFRWIVAETEPPYCVSVVTPGADVLALANAKVDRALALWARCVESDSWPGYPAVVHTAELPPWEEARFLARMEEIE